MLALKYFDEVSRAEEIGFVSSHKKYLHKILCKICSYSVQYYSSPIYRDIWSHCKKSVLFNSRHTAAFVRCWFKVTEGSITSAFTTCTARIHLLVVYHWRIIEMICMQMCDCMWVTSGMAWKDAEDGTKMFFRTSSMRPCNAIVQLVQMHKRIEILHNDGDDIKESTLWTYHQLPLRYSVHGCQGQVVSNQHTMWHS